MRATLRFPLFALIACLAAAPAAAQDPLAKRVSLDLKAMAPAEAFKVLADAVGLSVTVDPGVTLPVDVVVRNVKARTALDTICDSIDCRWTLSGQAISVRPLLDPRFRAPIRVKTANREDVRVSMTRIQEALKRPLPVGLKFDNTPLPEVANRLSQAAGVRVTFTGKDDTSLRVTVDVGQLPLMSALRRIAEQCDGRMTTRVSLRVVTDSIKVEPEVTIVIGGKVAVPRKKLRR